MRATSIVLGALAAVMFAQLAGCGGPAMGGKDGGAGHGGAAGTRADAASSGAPGSGGETADGAAGAGALDAPATDGVSEASTSDATSDAMADVTTADGSVDEAPNDASGSSSGDAVLDGGSAEAGDGGGANMPAALSHLARRDRILLRGTVVTPAVYFQGEVLIEGDTLTCVAASCAGQPGAVDASVVDTNGLIFPGLIDANNHVLFDVFDETDWSPARAYDDHNQWVNEPRYGALVDAKQYLNGEGGSGVMLGCELDKYGELKALVAGTTSVVGAANPADRKCYGSAARTVDQTPNGLAADKIQVATLFPSKTAADTVCDNFSSGDTDAYLINIADGVDAAALVEFNKLSTITTTPGCLYSPKTAILHGTALGDTELATMASHQMGLVWSPRSNVFLYGGGTDLSKTTNVPLARAKGLNVALATDWSIGGSQNLLDELRFADAVDNAKWGDVLSAKALTEMVTTNAAKVLGLGGTLGALEVGKKADVTVIGGDAAKPYDALLAATPKSVRLVLVGGVPLYGEAALQALGAPAPGCETLAICGANKFLCLANAGGAAADKLGQTLPEITTALTDGLAAYDALNLTAFKFSPIVPLYKCAP